MSRLSREFGVPLAAGPLLVTELGAECQSWCRMSQRLTQAVTLTLGHRGAASPPRQAEGEAIATDAGGTPPTRFEPAVDDGLVSVIATAGRLVGDHVALWSSATPIGIVDDLHVEGRLLDVPMWIASLRTTEFARAFVDEVGPAALGRLWALDARLGDLQNAATARVVDRCITDFSDLVGALGALSTDVDRLSADESNRNRARELWK